MNIYYFGYSLKMLKFLIDFYNNSRKFRFIGVVTQKGKYSDEFINMCNINNLCINVVENKKDLVSICEKENIKNVIMYEFGIIVPESICKSSTVINFHPGSLSNNRGANPINWSILIPELGAEICAYKILPQIDCGSIIVTKREEVTIHDTPTTLKEKLENNIPQMLKDVNDYLTNPNSKETYLITDGLYRNRVEKSDYTIDFENDTLEVILRKINSQKDYDGAILYISSKEYRIVDYQMSNKKLMLYTNNGTSFEKEIQEGLK